MEITRKDFCRIFSDVSKLKTKRLTLRKLCLSDYNDMYEYACDRSVTEYLLWDAHESRDQTYRYLETIQNGYKHGEFFDWAVIITETGKMIGTCGYTSFDTDNRRAEVGYVINRSYWGNGYATEACTAVMEFAFNELGMNRVEAHFIEGNDKSLRVMLRCGMKFEGTLRQYMLIKGRYRNIGICGITKDNFNRKGCYKKEKRRSWLENLVCQCNFT